MILTLFRFFFSQFILITVIKCFYNLLLVIISNKIAIKKIQFNFILQ